MVPGVFRPLAETSAVARQRVIDSTRRGTPLDERPEDEVKRALVDAGHSRDEAERIVAVVAKCLAGRRLYWRVQRPPVQADRKAEVAAARRSGLSWDEIAARLKVSPSTARRAYRAWLTDEAAQECSARSSMLDPISAASAMPSGERACSRLA